MFTINSESANQLRALLKKYGTSLCDEPRRCQALLMDLCGEQLKEIRALHMALESAVPQRLLTSKSVPYEIVRSRLAQKLVNEYPLSEEAALWSVEAWAFALELRNTLPQKTGNRAQKQEDSASLERQPVIAASEPVIAKPAHPYTNLNAEYCIDYKNGTIPLGDLHIGARVVDPSWEWEFRTGDNYTRLIGDLIKPVTWIVVAKDHYDGLEPHVTLLAEELIGMFKFDKNDRVCNHWGNSGTANENGALRPWLNSTGIHSGEGFYRAFSAIFKEAVITTTVPNKESKKGSAYNTQDRVFIPSTTELGDRKPHLTNQIGTTYPYYQGAGSVRRSAKLGKMRRLYWTRSPASNYTDRVFIVYNAGAYNFYSDVANYGGTAVRPALNLKAEILVSEIRKDLLVSKASNAMLHDKSKTKNTNGFIERLRNAFQVDS